MVTVKHKSESLPDDVLSKASSIYPFVFRPIGISTMKQNTTEAKNVKKVLGLYLRSISTRFNSSRLWIVASEKSQDSQQSTDPFVVCHQKYLLPSNWHEGLQHLSDYRIFWENAFNGRVLFFPPVRTSDPILYIGWHYSIPFLTLGQSIWGSIVLAIM